MKMILKGCRRCGGDLIPDRDDREHRTRACLQCGLEVQFEIVSPAFRIAAAERPIAA